MIQIPAQIIKELFDHAKTGLPEEVCGYLAGTDSQVVKHFRLTNIDHSNEHFSFDPNISYVIVSLAAEIPDIKSFRIKNGEVEKEEIWVI